VRILPLLDPVGLLTSVTALMVGISSARTERGEHPEDRRGRHVVHGIIGNCPRNPLGRGPSTSIALRGAATSVNNTDICTTAGDSIPARQLRHGSCQFRAIIMFNVNVIQVVTAVFRAVSLSQ
jgi:hypothetical protein